ncbi:MAG: hypothetical protein ACT4OU_02210 [Hyphomicrobium sp.]
MAGSSRSELDQSSIVFRSIGVVGKKPDDLGDAAKKITDEVRKAA